MVPASQTMVRAARCQMPGIDWSAGRTSRSAVHHQDERTRPHGRGEHSERIVLMSIDGGKPPLGLSFALDSPQPIIPVPSRQRSGRQDGSIRASRVHACDTQDGASEAHYDGHACGLLRIKRMSALCYSPHRPIDAGAVRPACSDLPGSTRPHHGRRAAIRPASVAGQRNHDMGRAPY